MPEYRVAFEVEKANTIHLPAELLADGHYRVECESDGSVNVFGNKNGLLYIANVLIRCALGGYEPGFHVHLPLDSSVKGPNVNASPEFTIYSPDAGV
jgi:hypothetical protein